MFEFIGPGTDVYLRSGLLPVFYSIILICYAYLLKKHGLTRINVLIFLIFLSGFFNYLTGSIEKAYKLFIFIYSFCLLFKQKKIAKYKSKLKLVIVSFICFSFIFFLSSLVNDINILLILGQYISRYFTLFILFLLLYFLSTSSYSKLISVRDLIIDLLVFQGIFSFIKMIMFGLGESLVGGIQFSGGGTVNPFPLIALGLLFHKYGFYIKEIWFKALLILLVPLASTKRSIWFYLPVYLFLMTFFVNREKFKFRFERIIGILIIIFLLFIVTIKLTPSLNPDNKIWGSFDLNYTLEYSSNYILGNPDKSKSTGRASNVTNMLNLIDLDELKSSDFIGNGFDKFRLSSIDEFYISELDLGRKGYFSTFSVELYSFGLLGILATIIYQLAIIRFISFFKIRLVYILFVFTEYFIYYNGFFSNHALVFSFFVLIFLYSKKCQNRVEIL